MIAGDQEDRTGSVGSLLSNTEAQLVDEDGNEVAEGERGELWIRGPQTLKGYWKNEEATKETYVVGGGLKTGHVATHKDGLFWIVDRKKELVKIRGFQVASAELEGMILSHDAISDCAVVSVHSGGEELPRAYVVLREKDMDQHDVIQSIVRHVAKRVARHKRLTGGVSVIESVPRSPSCKIQRKVVNNMGAERFEAARRKDDCKSAT